jgi:hypothetical protein
MLSLHWRGNLAEVYARLRDVDQRIGEHVRRIGQLAAVCRLAGPGGQTTVFGGQTRRGRISKRGDVYIETLLSRGVRTPMRHLGGREDRRNRWVLALKERLESNQAAVAMAAKHRRILRVTRANGIQDKVAAV